MSGSDIQQRAAAAVESFAKSRSTAELLKLLRESMQGNPEQRELLRKAIGSALESRNVGSDVQRKEIHDAIEKLAQETLEVQLTDLDGRLNALIKVAAQPTQKAQAATKIEFMLQTAAQTGGGFMGTIAGGTLDYFWSFAPDGSFVTGVGRAFQRLFFIAMSSPAVLTSLFGVTLPEGNFFETYRTSLVRLDFELAIARILRQNPGVTVQGNDVRSLFTSLFSAVRPPQPPTPAPGQVAVAATPLTAAQRREMFSSMVEGSLQRYIKLQRQANPTASIVLSPSNAASILYPEDVEKQMKDEQEKKKQEADKAAKAAQDAKEKEAKEQAQKAREKTIREQFGNVQIASINFEGSQLRATRGQDRRWNIQLRKENPSDLGPNNELSADAKVLASAIAHERACDVTMASEGLSIDRSGVLQLSGSTSEAVVKEIGEVLALFSDGVLPDTIDRVRLVRPAALGGTARVGYAAGDLQSGGELRVTTGVPWSSLASLLRRTEFASEIERVFQHPNARWILAGGQWTFEQR